MSRSAVLYLFLVFQLYQVEGIGCPNISVPANTNRTNDGFSAGTVALYACTEPETSFNDLTSTELIVACYSTGEWRPMPHPCIPRRCGPQPVVSHSIPTTSDTTAGTVVTISCMFGFGFPDGFTTKKVECDETSLVWVYDSDPSTFRCVASYCPHYPPDFETMTYEGLNLYVEGYGIRVGKTINGYCNEGHYRLNAVNLVVAGTCSVLLDYDDVYGECTKHTCRAYESNNTKIKFNNEFYQRRTSFQCLNGTFPGGATYWSMECDYNGQWNSEPALSGCQVGGCEDGWILRNTSCYYFSDHTTWGLRYYYAETSCNHKNAHLATITSQDENDFLNSLSYEVSNTDYWIGYHFDVSSNDWIWFDPPSNFTRWHRGYPEAFDCTRLSVGGVWRDRSCDSLYPYICKKPAMCSQPPTIENGKPDIAVIPKTLDVGFSVIYKCDTGYSFRSDGATERVVTCLPGAYYSYLENCQETRCPPVTRKGFEVRNAIIEGDEIGTHMSNLTWKCKPGFIFPDRTFTKVITCLPNRTWSYIPPACIHMQCPQFGTLNAIPKFYRIEMGDAELFRCNEGYEFASGESELVKICQADGQWLPLGDCWKKRCQPYYQVNGTVNTKLNEDNIRYGDQIEVACVKGYEFPDGTKLKKTKCGASYHWDPYLPICIRSKCSGGELPVVPHSTTNTTSTVIDSYVQYTCDDGYTFIDGDKKRVAYCDMDTLQWINLPTECSNSWPDIMANVVGAGVQASTALAAVTILLLCLALLYIMCNDCGEDRQIIPICKPTPEESDSEDDSNDDSTRAEPIRFEMAV